MIKPTILVVDDAPMNLKIIQRFLAEQDYLLIQAKNGEEALELLMANQETVDVVLLDRTMPGLDGLQVLAKIKSHKHFEALPVIFQTAKTAPAEIQEGLNAGAFYYLTKPFDKETLCAIVRAAVGDHLRYKTLSRDLRQGIRGLTYLIHGEFIIRTMEEVKDLVRLLAGTCPEPERVVLGLSEIINNSVEHGDLEISYQEKSTLLASGRWLDEIEQRLTLPQYRDRLVRISVRRSADAIIFNVKDEGPGFKWEQYLVLDPARAYDMHGRGIATAKLASFDWMEYKGNGNEVELGVWLRPGHVK